ncbi:MAG: hypothetical protein JWQ69_2616 [Pseudomonas sp.]|jgi:hypothetical protein|nr:hypothetical protein [Pseudomonas sp.]
MKSSYIKILVVASTLLLGACSGMQSESCFSEGCTQPQANNVKFNGMGSSMLGRSFSEYGSGLMKADQ